MAEGKPIGRGTRNRYTNEIIATSAIADEDWPYRKINESDVLWRYLTRDKFENLLSTGLLHFARGDQFSEPYEGRFSDGNKIRVSASDSADGRISPIAKEGGGSVEYQEINRQTVFVSCWHMNRNESFCMWREYAEDHPESVAVVTSGKRIYEAFEYPAFKVSQVAYRDNDFSRTLFDHGSLFFYKPTSCSHERELRILAHRELCKKVVGLVKGDLFRKVPVRLNLLIQRIVTHKRATADYKRHVEALIARHCPRAKRADSAV